MSKFVIYDPLSGKILRSGESNCEQPLGPGEAVLVDVEADPKRYRVVSGAVTPIEQPEPSLVPVSVSPWQIRRALNQLGLRASVEQAVAAADQDVKDGWEFATEFRRDNPLVAAFGQQLGITEEELDQLFILAANVV
jgi:hypothetical protein